MKVRKIGRSILVHLFTGYLKLLEKTIVIQWTENSMCRGNQVFGFWHEDSFFMNLVLAELSKQASPIDVIVTADTRGDYIQNLVERCGGHAIRVQDGFASFGALKAVFRNAYERTRCIAVALDGPLGPRHEPKKLAFFLAEQAQDDFVGITISYSSKLRLNWRWDKYVIPLPFSKVMVAVHNYGEIDKKQIPVLPVSANITECDILVEEI